jgi:hypothetical protein
MAITYPLTWPATLYPQGITLTPVNLTAQAPSPFTAARQTHEHQGKLWRMEYRMAPLTEAQGRELFGLVLALNGVVGTVLVGDMSLDAPRGVGTGTPLAATTGSPLPNRARQSELAVDGLNPNVTGILLRGDMLQIGSGSGSRLHALTADADSDGSGAATLDIWPPLRADVPDAAPITLAKPKGVFHLETNLTPIEIEVAKIYGLTLSFLEAL